MWNKEKVATTSTWQDTTNTYQIEGVSYGSGSVTYRCYEYDFEQGQWIRVGVVYYNTFEEAGAYLRGRKDLKAEVKRDKELDDACKAESGTGS